MSWLDNCIAIPTCGVGISPDFLAIARYSEIFAPLMSEIQQDEDEVSYQYNELKSLLIMAPSGYRYEFLPGKISVSFRYNHKQEKIEGDFRKILKPELLAYSDLLNTTIENTKNSFKHYLKSNNLKANRVGIVVAATLTEELAPPGISELIELFNSPWENPLIHCDSRITPEIEKNEKYDERCHISIRFDWSINKEINIVFDWYREYKDNFFVEDDDIYKTLDE